MGSISGCFLGGGGGVVGIRAIPPGADRGGLIGGAFGVGGASVGGSGGVAGDENFSEGGGGDAGDGNFVESGGGEARGVAGDGNFVEGGGGDAGGVAGDGNFVEGGGGEAGDDAGDGDFVEGGGGEAGDDAGDGDFVEGGGVEARGDAGDGNFVEGDGGDAGDDAGDASEGSGPDSFFPGGEAMGIFITVGGTLGGAGLTGDIPSFVAGRGGVCAAASVLVPSDGGATATGTASRGSLPGSPTFFTPPGTVGFFAVGSFGIDLACSISAISDFKSRSAPSSAAIK
ncbi:MAG: hypothetical protein P1U89_18970 [Verrucomicrobiales bacterium]|nr:hypothetical protein [Verrucomicrobiales bacterium]